MNEIYPNNPNNYQNFYETQNPQFFNRNRSPNFGNDQRYNMNNNNNSFLRGRLVTSYDEARASIIDFDGSIFYFPDISNNTIYTKQINLDGTSSVKIYRLQQDFPNQKNPIPEDVTNKKFTLSSEDIEKIIEQISPILSENIKKELSNGFKHDNENDSTLKF